MGKYRKKPVVVEAEQWNGSFPNKLNIYPWGYPEKRRCEHCNIPLEDHGKIRTLEGYQTVCPMDVVITGVKCEQYPCKPDIFEQTYEAV